MKPIKKPSYLTAGLLALLLAQGAYFLAIGAWSELFVVLVALVFSLVPYLVQPSYNLANSESLRVGIVMFTIAALVLGEIHNFYATLPWWDSFLHFFAGIGLTALGYRWLFLLVRQESLSAKPIFHTLFVATSATTVLVVWEIYEFTIDLLGWSSNRMQPSLSDTMIDIIVGMLGVTLAIIAGYRMLDKQKKNVMHHLVQEEK